MEVLCFIIFDLKIFLEIGVNCFVKGLDLIELVNIIKWEMNDMNVC